MTEFQPSAICGRGEMDGACWRPGDGVKHLSVPGTVIWARKDPRARFRTRCGLGYDDGAWQRPGRGEDDDDCWCPGCLTQAGIPFTLYENDDG